MIPKQVIEIVETKSQSKAAKATGSARTQARKERRNLAKVAARPQMPLLSQKAPHVALLGARASAKLETDEARRYFDSLIVPESGSAQFPDLSDYPTCPISSKYLFSPTPIQDSVTNKFYSIFAMIPSVGYNYVQPSAINNGIITWPAGPSNHPRYASYVANFAVYRTISMCARVINSTNLNNKQGLVYQDLVSQRTYSYATEIEGDLPINVSSVTSSPTVKVGSFSQEYMEDVPRAGWVPLMLNTQEFIPLDATNDNEVSIPAYPVIFIMVDHQTTTSENVQSITIEAYYNFEAVPLYQNMNLFSPTVCVGSPDKIATGLIENRDKIMVGVNATLKDFQRTVGTIKEYSRATNEIMGVLGSLGSPGVGFGFRSTVRRNDSELNRLLALLREFLPKDIALQHSDRKEVEMFLDCLRTIKDTIDLPDFPQVLASQASYRKTGPWKQELVSIDVMSSVDDPDFIQLPVSSTLKTPSKR